MTEAQKELRILIVDDHQMFMDGVKALLRNEKHLKFVAEALNGEAALEILAQQEIDLLITDISMPGMSGTELTRQVKQVYPDIKVLVITMYNDRAIVSEILMAEAEGYILKNTGKEELMAAIDRIADNGTYYSREILEIMLQTSIQQQKEPEQKALTPREIEIVQLVSQEFSTAAIAEKLFISPRTVDTHRKHILEKTGSRTIVGLMKYAFQHQLL